MPNIVEVFINWSVFSTQQYILSKVVLYALSFPESTESDTSGKAFLS